MKPPIARRKSLRGLGLIEVLVTVVVLALGLLGLAGLHAGALKSVHSALYRGLAGQLAIDMVDRMRANQADARAGSYELAGCAAASGPRTALALGDLSDWCGRLRAALPGGDGSIRRVAGGGEVLVSVVFSDQRGSLDGATSAEPVAVQARVWSE